MAWPLSHHSGDVPSNIQTDTLPSMDHIPHVSRVASYPIQQNKRIWRKLFLTTTRPHGRHRTIRGQDHPQPPTSREEKTIAILSQVAGLPRKRQHVGASRTPPNSAPPLRVSPP